MFRAIRDEHELNKYQVLESIFPDELESESCCGPQTIGSVANLNRARR